MRNSKTKSLFSRTSEGIQIQTRVQHHPITDHCCVYTTFGKTSDCVSKVNRSCALYLGVHVAEHVLSKIFNNVKMMRNGNPGYDFICNRDKLIDVKSSTIYKDNWLFHINRNKIADYFLCLAFDNRDDLNPIHLWLIPGNIVNNKTSMRVSVSAPDKWSKYEHPLEKVVECCDTIRGE